MGDGLEVRSITGSGLGGLPLVGVLTAAIGRELRALDPLERMAWPDLPTVETMTRHLGGVHRWVAEVVRTRSAAAQPEVSVPEGVAPADWYEEGRTRLLAALAAARPEQPCWVIGGRPGTVGFWHRRMVFENVKHLMDLRAAGGRPWEAAPELSPADWADGVDELFEVFLPRSRPRLPALPAPVVLAADDGERRWRIERDWNVSPASTRAADPGATHVSARTSDLALALWERADLRDRARFRVSGEPVAIDVLASAAIHPW